MKLKEKHRRSKQLWCASVFVCLFVYLFYFVRDAELKQSLGNVSLRRTVSESRRVSNSSCISRETQAGRFRLKTTHFCCWDIFLATSVFSLNAVQHRVACGTASVVKFNKIAHHWDMKWLIALACYLVKNPKNPVGEWGWNITSLKSFPPGCLYPTIPHKLWEDPL